jgi:hypothetical protein
VSAWSEDSLFIGRAIVLRLREQVTALRSVELIDEIEDRGTEPRQMPAAVVVLNSLAPRTVEPVQDRIPVEQLWLVMLAVASVAPAADRIATAVGPLIPACIDALHGWKPEGSNRPLGWVAGPRPDYRPKWSLYPLMFRAQLVTTG